MQSIYDIYIRDMDELIDTSVDNGFHDIDSNAFGPFSNYYYKYEIQLYEVRNVESWNGKTYVEIYDGPIKDIGYHAKWLLLLNSFIQPGNDFDLWWNKRKYVFYKQIKQEEMKKKGQTLCMQLINGYSKNLDMNIPFGIKNFVILYLMVDICVFREFYINADSWDKAILDPPSDSLILNNIKWQSAFKGPTGEEYKVPEQIYYYNYDTDFDANGEFINNKSMNVTRGKIKRCRHRF